MLSKTALFALTSMLVSATAWAVPQTRACRSGSQPRVWIASQGPMCLMLQDPWQDCAEDPWQLSARPRETFPDPWQDSADPWQPFTETVASVEKPIDDPWQPTSFLDPWQEGAEDPWQTR
jgi:hypothetical protein